MESQLSADPFSNPTPRKEEVASAFFLRQIGSLESEPRRRGDPFSNPTPRKEEVSCAFFLRQIGSLESETRPLPWDIQTHPPTKKPRPRKFLQHSPCGRAGLLTSLRSSPSRASRALAFAPLRGALCEPTRHRTKPCGFVRVAEAVGRRSRQARPALRGSGRGQ